MSVKKQQKRLTCQGFGWDETWKKLDFDDTVETLYKKLGLDKDDLEDRE